MICQKCSFPHANTLGCVSCGWKFDPDYHPDLGAAPTETAVWILAQSGETLAKLYGPVEAANKIAAAKVQLAHNPPSAPGIPPAPPTIITAVVEPVASPFAEAPHAPTEAEAEDLGRPVEPEPVDERIHATEAEAPTVENSKAN